MSSTKILVVDDEPFNLDIVGEYLEEEGYNLDMAGGLGEAGRPPVILRPGDP